MNTDVKRFSGKIDEENTESAIRQAVFCMLNTQRYNSEIFSTNYLENGEELTIRIRGNGFLYNMVRIIVGTLLRVGRGFYTPEQVKDILEARDRPVSYTHLEMSLIYTSL